MELPSTASVRRKVLDWRAAVYLHEPAIALLQDFAFQAPEIQDSFLHEDDSASQAIVALLDIITNAVPGSSSYPSYQRYALTLLDDLLQRDSAWLQVIARCGYSPFKPLIKIMHRDDLYTVTRACKVLTGLEGSGLEMNAGDEQLFLAWCCEILDMPDSRRIAMLGALQAFLGKMPRRDMFMSSPRGFDRLVSTLDETSDTKQYQSAYAASFSLWLLSYDESIAKRMSDNAPLVATVARVLRRVPREQEKIFRVLLLMTKNLLTSLDNIGESMVNCGYVELIRSLGRRQWNDEDILALLEELIDPLLKHESALSSFAMYAEEVKSAYLCWSPAHTSTSFWKANVNRMCDSNYALLRILIRLIASPQGRDAVVLSVACFDIGEFIRFHEQGKRIVEQLGGKIPIMNLMDHQSSEVKEQALLCMQKMMLRHWDLAANTP